MDSIIDFFQNQLSSLTINIISAFVYALIGIAFLKVFKYLKFLTTPFRRYFFKAKNSEKTIHLINASILKTVSRKKIHFLEEGDSKALNNVFSFLLSKLSKDEKVNIIKHSDAVNYIEKYPYFISVSGPIYNSVTSQYIKQCNINAKYNRENKSIDIGKNKYQTKYHENKSISKCYGLVIFSDHTTLRGDYQRFSLLFGLSSLSTYASTLIFERIFKDREFRKKHFKDISLKKNWILLFEVKNDSENEKNLLFDDLRLNYNIKKVEQI